MKSTMAFLLMFGSLTAKAAPEIGAAPLPPRRPSTSVPAVAPTVEVDRSEVGQLIRAQLEAGTNFRIGNADVDGATLKKFYVLRGYRPVWTDGREISMMGSDMELAFADAEMKGLRSSYYENKELKDRMEARDSQGLAEADLLLTQGFITYANDLYVGRVDPRDLSQDLKDIEFKRRARLSMEWLNSMVASPNKFRQGLRMIEPSTAAEGPNASPYGRLLEVLSHLKRAESYGGWPVLQGTPVLKLGDSHPNVVGIRVRMVDMGALPISERQNTSPVYDEVLKAAVFKVQQRSYLGKPDGIIGPRSYEMLNVSLSTRINQTRANLERWRLFPRKLGHENDPLHRYILVDMGRQELDVWESGSSTAVLNMRVIVGKGERQTPNMEDRVTSVVFRPYWNPPKSLIGKDILKEVKTDIGYFKRVGMRIFSGGQEVDPRSVDWEQYSEKRLPPFQFREDPGFKNSLGILKFNLGNGHSIYMHDTNNRKLFEMDSRLLSSGCIRVQNPIGLALYLLKDQGYDEERIRMETEDESNVATTVPLSATTVDGKKSSIPVYIMGTTMNAYRDGLVVYRDDFYGQDRRILNALDGKRVENPTSKSSADQD